MSKQRRKVWEFAIILIGIYALFGCGVMVGVMI